MKVFFCEKTGIVRHHLGFSCDCGARAQEPCTAAEFERWRGSDERRARTCDECGAAMQNRSAGPEREWRRVETGETFWELPVGAVYAGLSWGDEGDQVYNWRTNADGKDCRVPRPNEQDGRVLSVVCPDGHHWIIDARASNCTMPDDDTHWCWVRHGRPEDGTLHVDKNGNTCGAGAGSILTHTGWHGFLHNGDLYQC